MKVAVFFGFLACLNLATAGPVQLADTFEDIVKEIQDVLKKIDPASITDVSLTLLDAVTVTLKSASISDISKFEFPTFKDDGKTIKTTFSLPTLSANVDSLSIAGEKLGITASIDTLDAAVKGLTLDIDLAYTTKPLRVTTLDALAQITDGSVKGTAKLNDNKLNIDLGEDTVKKIDDAAKKYEVELSALIKDVINDILAIVEPEESSS